MSKEPLLGPAAEAFYLGGEHEGGGAAGRAGGSEIKPPSGGPGRWDPARNAKYSNNAIRTSKYTALTFLPKNLFSQFSKAANAYFLMIVMAQMVDEISITGGKPMNAPPLTLVVLISMLKDAFEDWKRQ